MKTKFALITCALAALFCGPAAHASVLMTLEQSGGDVVAKGTGSVNLVGLTLASLIPNAPAVLASDALLDEGPGIAASAYSGISGPTQFGTGITAFIGSSSTGDPLLIAGGAGLIAVPEGYGSGDPLSSTATWDNTTLADLGVTPGTYVWTWGSGADADSLTLNIVSPVPEPAPALLLLLGAAALALWLWSRRFRLRSFRSINLRRTK